MKNRRNDLPPGACVGIVLIVMGVFAAIVAISAAASSLVGMIQ